MVVQFLKEKNCEYICAPYEADFQLVFMEKQGKIQAILTEDGDLFVLGGSTLIMNLDLKATDDEGNRKPMCAIVRRAAVMAQPLFAGWSSDDVWLELGDAAEPGRSRRRRTTMLAITTSG